MWRASSGIPAAQRRPAQLVTIVGATLFTLVLCRWRPWMLFARGDFSSDFYDVQARAFLHGRLAVPADVADIEGFLIDGRTYLYYGPFLAIARLPTAIFGSWADGRLTRISMVVGFVLLCTVTFHLAVRVARMVGERDGATSDSSVGLASNGAPWRPALLVAAVACSPVLALAGDATVYHETELWAFVLVLATFVKLLDVLRDPTIANALLAAAASVATILTRVSVGLGAVTAVGIVAIVVWRRDRRLSLTMLGIGACGVAIHSGLNLAKVGTLFDLPADRQVLTLMDPDRAAWFAGNDNSFFGLHFIPTTLVHYLRPDAFAVERLVPFIRFGPRAHEFGSYPLESNTPSSSLTASATLLVVLAVIGAVIAVRHRHWQVTPLLAGAAVAAAPTIAIGFIANRYLVDLLPGLVVLGAVATAAFHVTPPAGRRAVALTAVAVLLAWGTAVNVALATWIDGIERPGFTATRYDIDDAVFGGHPPSVVKIDPTAPVPRDGVVGIDGPCDGLYIASQGDWVPLERAAGVRHLVGTFDPPDGTTPLLGEVLGDDVDRHEDPDGGDRIDVVADSDRAEIQLVFHAATGEVIEGSVLEWDGSPVEIDVVSDPTAGWIRQGLRVTVDGTDALVDFRAPDLARMAAHPDFAVTHPDDGGVPICTSLVRRGG